MPRSNQRWCSDGFEFRCDSGELLRVTFALDCCDREAMSWAATTTGRSGDIVRDVMLAAVENRFGGELHTPSEIEWLTDSGSGYAADDTRRFAAAIGLKPLATPVCSPQSNGMVESFVKTMKRDYVAFMPKPDAATAAHNLAIAFEHYNEKHPHSALKCRSPREFRHSIDSVILSVTLCPESQGQLHSAYRIQSFHVSFAADIVGDLAPLHGDTTYAHTTYPHGLVCKLHKTSIQLFILIVLGFEPLSFANKCSGSAYVGQWASCL